jgi:hypothetical protein
VIVDIHGPLLITKLCSGTNTTPPISELLPHSSSAPGNKLIVGNQKCGPGGSMHGIVQLH